MLSQRMERSLLVIRHPYIDPARMHIGRSRCAKQFRVRVGPEIKGTPSFLVAEVDTEIHALGIPHPPVEQIEVLLIVKVSKRVSDFFVAEVVVVCWEVPAPSCGSKRLVHGCLQYVGSGIEFKLVLKQNMDGGLEWL